MNLVGKIFVVLIFVMSLCFSMLAVAVYGTHRNWKEEIERTEQEVGPGKALGYKQRVDNLLARNQELKDQKADLERQVAEERKAKDQAVGKLESKYGLLKQQHDQLELAHAKLVQERRDAQAALAATQATLAALRTEVGKHRIEISQAQGDRDAHFKEVVRLTDELHQLINERERLKQRQLELVAELTRAKSVLRHNELSVDTDISGTTPLVDGIVTAVPRPDLVEISIGSDEGLIKGHQLEVYRSAGGGNTYVGRIHVLETRYDKSACKVDPKYRQSNIQRNDRVTSRIQP